MQLINRLCSTSEYFDAPTEVNDGSSAGTPPTTIASRSTAAFSAYGQTRRRPANLRPSPSLHEDEVSAEGQHPRKRALARFRSVGHLDASRTTHDNSRRDQDADLQALIVSPMQGIPTVVLIKWLTVKTRGDCLQRPTSPERCWAFSWNCYPASDGPTAWTTAPN